MAVIMIQQTFIDYRKIDHKIVDIENKIEVNISPVRGRNYIFRACSCANIKNML